MAAEEEAFKEVLSHEDILPNSTAEELYELMPPSAQAEYRAQGALADVEGELRAPARVVGKEELCALPFL